MVDYKEICQLIPHRPPFLWVDKVLEFNPDSIRAEKKIPADLELFQGHYPHYAIMPGVLLCEAVFQTGALLIGIRLRDKNDKTANRVPVLTRINKAKFKREVHPGDVIEMTVKLDEEIGSVWFMKGKVLVGGKVAVKVDFSCMLAGKQKTEAGEGK
jgi:3-hydroxyacyl-[acyl-carrier-protein] dehydratase